MTIVSRSMVSLAPQLLQPEINGSYRKMADALAAVQEEFAGAGVERIVYWSSQWLSVLGQMFQAGSNLSGVHVDPNWHETCELPFKFSVDRQLAAELCAATEAAGFPGKCVDYRDFPVDTQTILADRWLNPGGLPVTMVAANVYCDAEKTRRLAAEGMRVLESRKERIAVVGISFLTTSFHTVSIDLREDCIRGDQENQFVADFVRHASTGDWTGFCHDIEQARAGIRTDMALRVIDFLEGTVPGGRFLRPWKVLATGPLYGAAGIVAQI